MNRVVRALAAAFLGLLVYLSIRVPEPPCAPDDCPPPPPECKQTFSDRMRAIEESKPVSGEESGVSGVEAKDTEQECPPPVTKMTPFEFVKADIATLRYPGLSAEFFERDDAETWQRRFIALDFIVDREHRVAEITAMEAEADTPYLKWRTAIALANSHLRLGERDLARIPAERALMAVDDGGMDPRMRSDALFILAVASEGVDERVDYLDQAITADAKFFDAHFGMLSATTSAIAAGVREDRLLKLLEYQMRSIDFIARLENRVLLSELQIMLNQLAGFGSPTNPILEAYTAWFAGRTEDATTIIDTALERCPSSATPAEPQVCRLLRDFRLAIGNAASESGDSGERE